MDNIKSEPSSPSGMAEQPDDEPEERPRKKKHPATSRPPYTAGMKLRAIEYAEIHGNRAAGRALGMDESIIRKWRRHKDDLAKLSPRLTCLRRGSAKHPGLEQKLKKWVTGQQLKGRPVTVDSLRSRATAMAKQSSLKFNAGPSWAVRFLRRNGMQTSKERDGETIVDGRTGMDDPEIIAIAQDDRLPDFVDPKLEEPSPDGAIGIDGEDDCPVMSNGYGPDESMELRDFELEMENKLRNCEARVLSTPRSELTDYERSHCELCGQLLRFKKRAMRGSIKSFRDLRLCVECMDGLKLIKQLARPATEDRLRALESAMDAVNARLNELDPSGGHAPTLLRSPGESDDIEDNDANEPEADSVARLRRENAELRRRLLRYERAEQQITSNGRPRLNSNAPTPVRAGVSSRLPTKPEIAKKKSIENNKKVASKLRRSSILSTPKPPETFVCPQCPQLFTSQSTLQRHLKRHPASSSTSDEADLFATVTTAHKNINFRCPFCSQSFEQRASLQLHLRKCHQRHPARIADDDSTVDVGLLCGGCGKKFVSPVTLQRHSAKCVAAHDDRNDGYLELAEMLEPGVVIDEPEMTDGEASTTLMDQLNRLIEPAKSRGLAVKLEPVDVDV